MPHTTLSFQPLTGFSSIHHTTTTPFGGQWVVGHGAFGCLGRHLASLGRGTPPSLPAPSVLPCALLLHCQPFPTTFSFSTSHTACLAGTFLFAWFLPSHFLTFSLLTCLTVCILTHMLFTAHCAACGPFVSFYALGHWAACCCFSSNSFLHCLLPSCCTACCRLLLL